MGFAKWINKLTTSKTYMKIKSHVVRLFGGNATPLLTYNPQRLHHFDSDNDAIREPNYNYDTNNTVGHEYKKAQATAHPVHHKPKQPTKEIIAKRRNRELKLRDKQVKISDEADKIVREDISQATLDTIALNKKLNTGLDLDDLGFIKKNLLIVQLQHQIDKNMEAEHNYHHIGKNHRQEREIQQIHQEKIIRAVHAGLKHLDEVKRADCKYFGTRNRTIHLVNREDIMNALYLVKRSAYLKIAA